MLSSQTQVQQSSTHMMQTTRSGRPFVKDLHDLFSTLIISLPMETHRGLFKSYVNSFTAEEAIANLGSLKFTQSSRNLDPENPTRIITTTTTTTFSMVKDMAKSVCQTFLNAKLFETLSDPNSRSFKDKNVYGLTSKGTYILERFVSRNGITAPHLTKIFSSQKIPIRLFVVERNSETDSIILSKQNVESVFRRFAGSGPNIAGKDEEEPSITFAGRNIGIEVKERLFNNKKYSFGFSGMAACDWLCEFTTLITKEEAMRIATEFIRHGLLEPINDKVGDTKPKQSKQVSCLLFKYSKSIYYNISEEGRRLALWEYDGFHGDESKLNLLNEEESRTINSHRSSLNDHRESKTKKLQQILEDSNLCSLFMNFLKSTLCEENLLFLLDVREFKTRHSKNVNENGECRDPEEQKNLMIDAFKIYNTYLAPASPHELNIDSNLSKSMSQFMTSIDSKNDDDQRTPITDHLYDDIQDVIFRLMATDSMPKFIKTKEYLAYERGSEEVITSK